MSEFYFVAGGALTEVHDSVYVTRAADRDALLQLRRMNYLMLIEPRQQGKTSLINHVMYSPFLENFAFAYADVATPGRDSEEDWYHSLSIRILRQLRYAFESMLRPKIPSNSSSWRDFLTELATWARDSQTHLVIALDEIGAVTFPRATGFFSVLRDVYNSRQAEPEFTHLTFLLSGAFHPRNLIEDDRISPFNVAHRLRLDDFNLTEVQDLAGKGPCPPDQVIALAERIHFWTDGQPYLTQLLCTYLHFDAVPTDVDASIERLRREDENHLAPILERLHRDEELRQYVDEVRAGKRIKFYPREHRRQAQLELLGVIKADEEGYCRIRNRIYEHAFYQRDNSTATFPVPVWGQDGSVAETLQDSELLIPMQLLEKDWGAFKLQLGHQTGLDFEARALETPMGEPRANGRLPFDAADLIAVLKVLENRGYNSADFTPVQVEALQRLGLLRDGQLVSDLLKRIGEGLSGALLTGEVGVAFRVAFNQARKDRVPIFLQLRFDDDAVDLVRYPWELLHDGKRHLSSAGAVELVRYITYGEAAPTLPVKPPTRLLFIESRPTDLTTLPSDTERRVVWNALQPLSGNRKLILDRLDPPTYKSLLDHIARADYHMIHFDGHGIFARHCPQCKVMNYPHLTTCDCCQEPLEDVSPQGYLAFENRSRQADFVSTSDLENLLLNSQVRLIFLSACQTGVVRGDSLFGGLGPGLIRAGVPAVVAMQFPVPVETTINFAESFYKALARGETVSRAVAQGRRSLFRDGTWFIPTLYLRSQDDEGHIFAA